MNLDDLRRNLFDPNRSSSLSAGARLRRWDYFLESFPKLNEMRILDLGGTPSYWMKSPVRPSSVRCVNLDPSLDTEADWIEYVVADACARQSGNYDLVVSNSLLEHVGGMNDDCVSTKRFMHPQRSIGCKLPTATSLSSHTGFSPVFSSCQQQPRNSRREVGHSDTSSPMMTQHGQTWLGLS